MTDPARRVSVDLCVIGAGSGGLSVAAGAAQLGRSVALIEKGEMGGDCLNYGCVPSKAMIAAANAAHAARAAAKYGVDAAPRVDYARVIDHVAGVLAGIAPQDSQERFEGLGGQVCRDTAAFVGPREVRAGDTLIAAKHIVLATGSAPVAPPIDGLDAVPYFTNETLFTNRVQPTHLLILGGGPIGAEMAQAHARLGSKVTMIDAAQILAREAREAVEILRASLAADGVDILENVSATRVAASGDEINLTLSDGRVVAGSHLLVAVGRRATLTGLGLDKAGIETDAKGLILDDRLRTTNKRVYAVGDVAGGAQFTHVAGDHASTVVRNVLFKVPAKRRDHLAPRVTYTDPEIASVGLNEDDARAKDGAARSAHWTFAENDRAKTERREDGFIRVSVAKNGAILGATIVGKGAGDEIGAWARAMAAGQKIKSFTDMIAPYPTRSEVSKRVAGAYYTPTLFSDRTRRLVKWLSLFD